MDKAILFGLFDFVNFHICKSLLNKGLEVTGIHLAETGQIEFLEEKRLEVGRNANLIEQSLSEWGIDQEKSTPNTSLIISIYDLFMSKKEQILEDGNVTKQMVQYLEGNRNEVNNVLILPVQILTSTFRGKEIEGFLDLIKGVGNNTQSIYLPAVYGPWQSNTFLFQKVLSSKYQEIEITTDEREWSNDVLFINDALESIVDIIETGEPGSFVLESGQKNQWLRCADHLNIAENHRAKNGYESLDLNSDIVKVSVKKGTSLKKSIQEQKDHVQRLYANQL
ncbi:hypothetical protein COJ96_08085 [Bacillus sp. AFS073361]|uniref:hypothetical protein n=1 Tax=Bacillus sp. AFS073361 TaxID=2033511 RepID=UPI000BFA98D7|nr:hypothetical protein [Bacillus sp. AFS073361]PFP29646.1 hypothetical protein COJ96_08085 [Bacillus sp. AFS073361]